MRVPKLLSQPRPLSLAPLERRGFQLRCGPPGASNIKEVLMELLQVLMECPCCIKSPPYRAEG